MRLPAFRRPSWRSLNTRPCTPAETETNCQPPTATPRGCTPRDPSFRAHSPFNVEDIIGKMAQRTLHLMTLVQHPPCAPLPSQPDTVQLLSRTLKPANQLSQGEQGILLNDAGALGHRQFDPETYDALQRFADAAMLRQAYADWYKKRGRQAEKELLQLVQGLARGTPLERYCRADRFRDVLRQAIVLAEEEDAPSLLDLCKDAIVAHGKYDAVSFVELQGLIRECNGSLQKSPTRGTVEQAAHRLLQHKTFAMQLAAEL